MKIEAEISTAAPAPASLLPRVRLLRLDLHAITQQQAVDHVMERIRGDRGGWVITPNLDHLRRFTKDPDFAALFKQADLVVADGMPLVWAGRFQGTPLPERVAGSDLIWSLSAAAAENDLSIYLLGGDPGTAQEAGDVLCSRHPALKVVGAECPPHGFEKDDAAVDAIVARLKEAQPGIVFVALGSPKQEQFIARIRHHLPRAWFIGVGISFSFVSGRVKRAPRWMRKMEWVHRLIQEPRRLAKRYLIDDLPFMAVLMASAFTQRMKTSSPSADLTSPKALATAPGVALCDSTSCLSTSTQASAPDHRPNRPDSRNLSRAYTPHPELFVDARAVASEDAFKAVEQ